MKNKMEVKGDIYIAGVYAMVQKDEEKVLYVGSALECNDALSRHLHYLKRGLYTGTNKEVLQKEYDLNNLEFVILKQSEFTDKVSEMGIKDRKNVQKSLEVLEQFYYNLNKDTACNSHKIIRKHSSNKNGVSTFRRRQANLGTKNPNAKYEEELIRNIIWLKENTELKNKEISELILDKLEVEIKPAYIAAIGNTKWISFTGVNNLNLLNGLKEVV